MDYLSSRIRSGVISIVVASVACFALIHLAPGDPARIYAVTRYGEDVTRAEIERTRHEEGLDKPLPLQYLVWLQKAVRGDLGRSIRTRRRVTSELADRLPYTALLAAVALAITIAAAFPLGILAACWRRRLIGRSLSGAGVLFLAVPSYCWAIILVLVLSVWLGWLPSFGAESAAHLVMPSLSLAIGMVGLNMRVIAANVGRVLDEPFVVVVRAKGAPGWRVLVVHALRNALIPVITILVLDFARLLEGAVLVESLFGWPGIGQLAARAALDRDLPLLQGCLLVMATGFVLAHLATDVLYMWIDPRVRLAGPERSHGETKTKHAA